METRDGVIKWYDPERGYGFVKTIVAGDSPAEDALLLSTVLQKYGAAVASKDAEVVVEVKRSSRGLAVTNIVSMKIAVVNPLADFTLARVKWYNAEKGYGFVMEHGTTDVDIFVHAEVVKKARIATLEPDQDVFVRILNGAKGKKVVEVRLFEAPVTPPQTVEQVDGPVGSE